MLFQLAKSIQQRVFPSKKASDEPRQESGLWAAVPLSAGAPVRPPKSRRHPAIALACRTGAPEPPCPTCAETLPRPPLSLSASAAQRA